MVNFEQNRATNRILSSLYLELTAQTLQVYNDCFQDTAPPHRINEFGIIDESLYNTEHGILFICKETNGWCNSDFECGCLFRNWLRDVVSNGITENAHTARYPRMWRNIGRWAHLLHAPALPIVDILGDNLSAVTELKTIAFTNINKVRGMSSSGSSYYKLSLHQLSGELLRKEIAILNPEKIVCCGTSNVVRYHIGNDKRIIEMPHPCARISDIQMLKSLQAQALL